MTERQIISDKLKTILQSVDSNYRVEQRLRRETFDATSRLKRVEIMGENTTYAEVLSRSPFVSANKASNTRSDYSYTFDVNIWYGYQDNDIYDNSSQKVFDDVVREVMNGFGNFGGETRDGNWYYVDEPQGNSISEVALSNDGKELAHYLTFQITVRRKK
jgi:hypothetical protein